MQRQVADGVVNFCRAVDGSVLGVCEENQFNPIFFAVDCPHLSPLLAVVNDDLIVLAWGDDAEAIRTVVDAVDFVRVLPEYLGDFKTFNNVVHELHFAASCNRVNQNCIITSSAIKNML